MSIKERAAKLLTPTREKCQRVHNGEGGEPCMFCEYNAETAADMLADAGLLAPDLPEPQVIGQKMVWPLAGMGGWTVSLHSGWVRISDERGAVFGVDAEVARSLGLALLAATSTGDGHP